MKFHDYVAAISAFSCAVLTKGQRIGEPSDTNDESLYRCAGDDEHPRRLVSECTIDNLPKFPAGVKPVPITSFFGMGDTPYKYEDRYCLNTQLRELDLKSPGSPSFIVHVGDIKVGKPEYPCNREAYSDIAEIFSHSNNAVNYDARDCLFVPGDNEWNDCEDIDEAWDLWMEHFGPGNKYGFGNLTSGATMSRHTDAKTIDGRSRDENFAFFQDKVLYMGVNIVGGDVIGDERKRFSQNVEWVRRNLKIHDALGMKGVVVFAHAQVNEGSRLKHFGAPFSRLAGLYPDVPMMYFHGNGHNFCVSNPFPVRNLVDVEVEDGDSAPPLKVTLLEDPVTNRTLFDIDVGVGRYRDKVGGYCKHTKEKTWSSPAPPPGSTPPPTTWSLEQIIIGPDPTPRASPPPAPPVNIILPPPLLLPRLRYQKNPPRSMFPLSECQGGCTSNRDCKGNLKCFKRRGREKVPGCVGNAVTKGWYCYDGPGPTRAPGRKRNRRRPRKPRAPRQTVLPPPLENVPEPKEPLKYVGNAPNKDLFPLGECQGDCDNNMQCQTGLYCLERSNGDSSVNLSQLCSGTPSGDVDYCVPYPKGVLVMIGNNGDPGHHFPLDECQGDCDHHGECKEGLKCFRRNGSEKIPGCMGAGKPGRDYCYNPNAQ